MVGSLAKVEVVMKKVHRKNFRHWQGVLMVVKGFEAFCDEGRIAKKGLKH